MADIKKEILDFNLNGTDWSNLYHVDYSGGSGGDRHFFSCRENANG